MKVETFEYQFKGMRKPDDIIVYPRKKDEKEFIFQGSRLIGSVDPETARGMLNFKGSNSKYFMHLSKFLGAVPYEYPREFINMVKEYSPEAGDLIGTSPITGPVYLA